MHEEQQEHFDESDEGRTQFNVDEFLSTLEEILVSMKELLGQEDIAEYCAQLEEAQIESLRVAKEEKKRRKAEARTKLTHEGGSSAAPTATQEPLPGPTVSLLEGEETPMDMSSPTHDQGQEQDGEQVPQQGMEIDQEQGKEQGEEQHPESK